MFVLNYDVSFEKLSFQIKLTGNDVDGPPSEKQSRRRTVRPQNNEEELQVGVA